MFRKTVWQRLYPFIRFGVRNGLRNLAKDLNLDFVFVEALLHEGMLG